MCYKYQTTIFFQPEILILKLRKVIIRTCRKSGSGKTTLTDIICINRPKGEIFKMEQT